MHEYAITVEYWVQSEDEADEARRKLALHNSEREMKCLHAVFHAERQRRSIWCNHRRSPTAPGASQLRTRLSVCPLSERGTS